MNLALKEYIESNVWDSRYDLPLLPDYSNPWIYGAYAYKIIKQWGEDQDTKNLFVDFMLYSEKCKVETGLYHRWPDGFGGVTSHDEVIGLCYISSAVAKDILAYLDFHDGQYNNMKNLEPSFIPDRYNLYRFFWLRPYIAECAKATVSIISQLKWAAWVITNAMVARFGDWDTKCFIWLMSEKMENYTICKAALMFWQYRMKKKGMNPHVFFENALAKYPVYANCVKATF